MTINKDALIPWYAYITFVIAFLYKYNYKYKEYLKSTIK